LRSYAKNSLSIDLVQDLLLEYEIRNNQINFRVRYKTSKISITLVQRFVNEYKKLFCFLLDNFNSSLELQDIEQKLAIQNIFLKDKVSLDRNSDIQLPFTTVMGLIRESAERREDFVAVEDGNVCITYSELWKRSGLVAIALRKRRVGLESRVCIYMDKSVEMIISILGVLRSGGAYVPVDIGYPKKRVEYILKHSGCSVLITKGRSEEFNNFSGYAVDVDYLFDSVKGEENDLGHIFFCEGISEENLAYIMYTSGSSGLPKGVMGLHRNLDSSIMSRMVEYDVKNEKSLFIVSGAFDSSITAIFWPLAEGGCLNIEAGRVGVNELEERIWKEKVTHLATPVGLYLELLREGRHERLKSLRLVIVAGEQCPDEISDLHYEKMKNTYLSNEYGPTEASVWSSFDIIKENGKSRCIFKHSRLDVKVYILDRYLKVLPVGHVGEIYLSGLCLTRGIIGKPTETSKIYLSNPYFNHEKDEPYHKFIYQTSGIGRYLLDGKIEFLGYNHKIFENLVT
jgi:non-ribosomal peptide synthetase component F